jgi:hypothetical protein
VIADPPSDKRVRRQLRRRLDFLVGQVPPDGVPDEREHLLRLDQLRLGKDPELCLQAVQLIGSTFTRRA